MAEAGKQYGVRIKGKLIRARFMDPKLARAWQTKLKYDQQRATAGFKTTLEEVPLHQMIEDFLEARQDKESSQAEMQQLATYVLAEKNPNGTPMLEPKTLFHTLTKADWLQIFGENGTLIQKHALMPSSHNQIRMLVGLVYKHAMEHYTPPRSLVNPISSIKALKFDKAPIEVLESHLEMQKYIDAAMAYDTAPHYGMVAMLALNTGLRLGAIIGLRWCDVDLNDRVIYARRKYSYRLKGFVDGQKGRKTGFKIGMNKALAAALQAHRASLGYVPGPEDHIIGRSRMTPMKPGVVDYYHRQVMKLAELPYRKFHALRHTFATQYLEAGGQLTDLKEILGHKNIQTTMIYVQFLKSRMTEKADRFEITGTQGMNVVNIRQVAG